ncbi:hypothetical protein HDU90_008054 [Geranomyces variabilis]|nr:hypothetical protein HDU90_008054 [Geranomyces variabilis]
MVDEWRIEFVPRKAKTLNNFINTRYAAGHLYQYHDSISEIQQQDFEVTLGEEWITTNMSVFQHFQAAVRPAHAPYALPFLKPFPTKTQEQICAMLSLDDLSNLCA